MSSSTPCPSDGLTARGRLDGFGAQYSALRARHPCSTVHVTSEGNATALQYLGDVRLHVNEGVEATFHHMVHADALLVASSTFSGVASFLSRGEAWACGRGRLVSAPGGGPYARTNPWYWVRR